MSDKRRANLKRLLRPRHIAFIGGADASYAAQQCAETFDGQVWGVNPKRSTMGAVRCYPDVASLPDAPDAVFLATPRKAAAGIVQQLSDRGAGGVACFTAGYGELGEAGRKDEQALIEAAGDMALVGPNCYGLINYTNGAVLWPFGAGRHRCEKGFALVMQSGMLPANCTMNDRSAPISYVVSAGNQSLLAIEDYIDVLVDDDSVSAIGLYIEGIKDLNTFCRAGRKALLANKPVVVLKAGRSQLAADLAVSHTGSLSGSDDAFQALFDRLGMIRVDAPVTMLETLKFLSVSGAPTGRKLAAFTCSGGDAAMVADYAEKVGMELVQPSNPTRENLTGLLPDIATVSNPLDYTTPIWGNREIMPGVFSALMADGYDAAVVIQDFPPPHIHDDNTLYSNDAKSFIQACQQHGIPGAVCSDLPENLDRESREMIIAGGVTPLQGLDSGLTAMSLAMDYGIRRDRLLNEENDWQIGMQVVPHIDAKSEVLDEWQGKQLLVAAGVSVPRSQLCDRHTLLESASQVGYPLVLKAVCAALPHKSDAGGVCVGIGHDDELLQSVDNMIASVQSYDPNIVLKQLLLEQMVADFLAELLVGVKTDPQFGQILVLASGGVMTELLQDSVTLLFPVSQQHIREALQSLKLFPLLTGFRGKPACDLARLVNVIYDIAMFAESQQTSLVEMDVNPLLVTQTDALVADVLIRKVPENRWV